MILRHLPPAPGVQDALAYVARKYAPWSVYRLVLERAPDGTVRGSVTLMLDEEELEPGDVPIPEDWYP